MNKPSDYFFKVDLIIGGTKQQKITFAAISIKKSCSVDKLQRAGM